MYRIKIILLLVAFMVFSTGATAQSEKESFDFGWLFNEQEVAQGYAMALDDSSWQKVALPHDWDIYHAPALSAATGNDGGYYPCGVGWYRKHFATTKCTGTVKLHFDGVYQCCQVYVNGVLAGTHNYGYTPFSIDITDKLAPLGEENVVAVRVDNSEQPNCRWYSGSGIYRHVWLETFREGAIDDPSQLFIRTQHIYGISAEGTRADSVTVHITYADTLDEVRTYYNVSLWSPDNPILYNIMVGALSVQYGFRTVSYDASKGFCLNGKPLLINGACVHHDNGILGAMAFDAAESRRVRLLKEAGFNLIRTAHNPPSAAFINACDSLGMLVIDEAFDGWRTKKTEYDYHSLFDEDYASDIAALVLRDRNHPSVICWSIGNEVMERKEIAVIHTARQLKTAVLQYDNSRPITEALCSWDDDWEIFDPHAEVLDIVGYNYMMHKHDGDHQRCPTRVMWQTESYPRDAFLNWSRTKEYPYIIGDIVWTGMDYLGEAGIGQYYHPNEPNGEHYIGKHFPFHGAYCGDVDITGWRKPISHYREMLWNNNTAPILYIAVKEPAEYYGGVDETQWSVWPTWESWTWKGWEGKTIEVEAYTRAAAVNLYLNDRLVGTQKVDSTTEFKATFAIDYQPGVLHAVALDETDNELDSKELITVSEPTSVRLTADRNSICADGQDLAFVTIEVLDKDGNVVPNAAIPLTIGVSGAGQFVAAGSANMQDNDPTTNNTATTWQGRALLAVRSTQETGDIEIKVKSTLAPAILHIKTVK